MDYVELNYEEYRQIMDFELKTMCKLLDDLEKSIERRKEKENGSVGNTPS